MYLDDLIHLRNTRHQVKLDIQQCDTLFWRRERTDQQLQGWLRGPTALMCAFGFPRRVCWTASHAFGSAQLC